jgi:hypothetical protein
MAVEFLVNGERRYFQENPSKAESAMIFKLQIEICGTSTPPPPRSVPVGSQESLNVFP